MKYLKKIWHFIWKDNSLLSWIVNVLIAFILVKFIIYPGAGFLLSTTHPVVAVVSSSMEHNMGFDEWWNLHGSWYEEKNISKEIFNSWNFKNGFNKGDLILLMGFKCDSIGIGDVIVYNSNLNKPIIHRVVEIDNQKFTTKGDNVDRIQNFERSISYDNVIGFTKYNKCSKGLFKVPLLGWVKIMFTEITGFGG